MRVTLIAMTRTPLLYIAEVDEAYYGLSQANWSYSKVPPPPPQKPLKHGFPITDISTVLVLLD